MQIVCKDLKQHEMMVNELQDVEGIRNFFLADPGRACYKFSKISFTFTFLSSRLWYNSSCDCDGKYGTIWVSLFLKIWAKQTHIQSAGPAFL